MTEICHHLSRVCVWLRARMSGMRIRKLNLQLVRPVGMRVIFIAVV